LALPAPATAANTSRQDFPGNPRPLIHIDTDGDSLHVKETPFFPVGYWWGKPEPELSSSYGANCMVVWDWRDQDLDDLIDAGLKLIINPIIYDFADPTRGMGKYYSFDCGSGTYSVDTLLFRTFLRDSVLTRLRALNDSMGVIGWYLADEPDIASFSCGATRHFWRPQDLEKLYAVIKTEPSAAFRDVYMTLTANGTDVFAPDSIAGIRGFAVATDVLMNDENALINCCGFDSYWEAGYNARLAGAYGATAGKPFLTVPHSVGPCSLLYGGAVLPPSHWANEKCGAGDTTRCATPGSERIPPRSHDGQRWVRYWPQYHDLRHLTYSPLVEGARGVLYFNWAEGHCMSPDTTTHNMVKALSEELLIGKPSERIPGIATVLRQWTTWDSFRWSCNLDGHDDCAGDSAWFGSYDLDDVINYYVARDPSPSWPPRWILIAANDCADTVAAVSFSVGNPYVLRSVRVLRAAYSGYSQDTLVTFARDTQTFGDEFLPWAVRAYEIVGDTLTAVSGSSDEE
jgi:hypothetical protein